MEREVRYCTTEDGVRIAYCVEGDGPPLVVVPQALESFSLTATLEGHERLLKEVSAGRRLIRFDRRGCGLSQRAVTDVTPAAFALDIDSVIAAVGSGPVALLSGGTGGMYSVHYAANRPDTVGAIVLVGALVRLTDLASADVWKSFATLGRSDWPAVTRAINGITLRRSPDIARKTAEIYQQSLTGDAFAMMVEQGVDVDVTPELERIRARTLVIHSRDDAGYPFAGAQDIAARVPDGRLVTIGGNVSLLSIQDEVEAVAATINRFLDESPDTRALPREQRDRTQVGLRTVLFTDLVGHTEMMSRLGDEAGRAVLREHEAITRNVLKQHGGAEIKTMGDGFMASFASVTRAVECAIALQRAIEQRNNADDSQSGGSGSQPDRSGPDERNRNVGAHHDAPLRVRCGLNAGEPIEEDGDLFGATVILASRIAAKADAGEILVADTVRGLCSGKGFLFSDRGEFVAKGFKDPVRIYEVNWHA
jgi:class 3 adenylate cyclase